MAELMADEVRELALRFPEDVRIVRALADIEASERRDLRLDALGRRTTVTTQKIDGP
jgi:hypothetical protein